MGRSPDPPHASGTAADPYPRQLHHFARVIRGEEKPVIDAAEGARTLAATLAIAESAKTGRPVEVSGLH